MAKAELDGCAKAAVRRLAMDNLFFLLWNVCNRKDMDRDWLFDRCNEVQENPDGYLDLWAREHYKSTIITFGLTIQDILNDPEITVGIFSFNRPTAKSFLRQIKREFEGNDRLKSLFPDILWHNPRAEAPKWSEDDGIVVKRKGNMKESTVEAWGLVDGQPTGRHFKRCVYDDVVTRESVTTPDMIAKVTEAWELSVNLGAEGGTSRYIGTRYHYADTYQSIIDRGSVIPRVYAAIDDKGKPVLMSMETLQKKRIDMGPYVYSCQMLQDPVPKERQIFSESWLKYWPAEHYHGLNLYLLCDPANEKAKGSDYTVMMVVGVGADKNHYVVTMIRDRLNLVERTRLLFRLHREYRPYEVRYEQYGMQADIQHIEAKMDEENYRFTIRPVGGKVSKIDRIMRLIPPFEAGTIYLPQRCPVTTQENVIEDMTRVFINQEYKAFPYMEHDDMLDCMARLFEPELYIAYPEHSKGNIYGSTKQQLLDDMDASDDYDPLYRRAHA